MKVESLLPGKGCRGTAGSWHRKRHTTGGGTERPGGSHCPGGQGPGSTGVQGKGKASGGQLSNRGPWEFSCKDRVQVEKSGTRQRKEWFMLEDGSRTPKLELGGLGSLISLIFAFSKEVTCLGNTTDQGCTSKPRHCGHQGRNLG